MFVTDDTRKNGTLQVFRADAHAEFEARVQARMGYGVKDTKDTKDTRAHLTNFQQ